MCDCDSTEVPTSPTTGAPVRTVAEKLYETISVKDFGAKGNGSDDDTAAIMAAFNYAKTSNRGALLFPPGRYCVTSMSWTGNSMAIRFDRAQLYGIATTSQPALLTLHNFRQSTISGLEIETDGDTSSPTHYGNYGCALRLSTSDSNSPTQFLTIDGIFIRYFKAGIVHGNLIDNPPQPSYAQSEIFIRNYKVRGVQQLFFGNATNGYITFSGCVFSRFCPSEVTAPIWDASSCFNIRNDAGMVISIGDEFQVSEAGGYNNYGKDITIIGPVYEHSVADHITGDYSISGLTNGYYGSGALTPITIAPGSTGRLLLNDVKLRRPDGTAGFSGAILIDAKESPGYKIAISNSRFIEWPSNLVNASVFLVRGGHTVMQNVEVDNSASEVPSFAFDDIGNTFNVADPTGESISTTPDLSAKGGWVHAGGSGTGAFHKYTTNLPPGETSAIRLTSSSATVLVASPNTNSGFRVDGGTSRTIRMMLLRLGPTTSFAIQAQWFSFSGTQIGNTSTVFASDAARLTSNGFDAWSELRIPANVPSGAAFGRIIFSMGSTCDVAVTGIKVV